MNPPPSNKPQTQPTGKPALSEAKILDTALTLANETGLEALSMRKLADRLGVKAMSLYNHVANKDAMLEGMVERVMSKMQFEWRGQDWQQCMLLRARQAYHVLSRYPWATQLLVSRVNAGANMLHYVDDTLGCLHEAGFSLEDADHAWNAMDSFIYGYILQEQNFPFAPEEYASTAEAYLDAVPASDYPYLHQLTKKVLSQEYSGLHDFELGFTHLLNGLAGQLERK